MKKTFLLLLIILLYFITTINAQQTFEKAFGGLDNGEWQSDLKEMKKNDYLVTGYTDNFGAGSYDAYCIRLNKAGKMLWAKTYGTSLSEYGTKCWGTTDGGFILLFNSHYVGSDIDSNMFVVKCNKDGNMQWSKCIKPFKKLSITPAFIYQSIEGDYYILCDWYEKGYYYGNFTLIKLNATGNLIWEKAVNTQPLLRSFTSSQISETDKGDILISGTDQGDNYDSYGSYTIFFLFSKTTGAIKLCKKIIADQYEGSYLNIYNFVVEKNKLYATGDYSRDGFYYKICWFTVTSENMPVKAKYIAYNNFHSYQYLINKKFIKQPEEGFYSNLLFTQDGGYLYAYRYTAGSPTYYDIIVDKYDSLGRICPKFEIPVIDTNIHEATFYVSDKSYSLLKDSITVTDSSVTVADVTSQRLICSGDASLIADKMATHTNIISENLSEPSLQLYPNPATNFVTISFEMSKAATIQIEIINAEGKSLLKKQLFASVGKQQAMLNIQNIPAGVYYLKINGAGKPTALKLLKEE